MKWKVISYSSLIISILSLGLAIKNLFFWDGVTTFIEKTTGLAEPFGTLLLLLLFVLGGAIYLYIGRAIPLKKIAIGTLIGLVLVLLVPLALIMIHMGEL